MEGQGSWISCCVFGLFQISGYYCVEGTTEPAGCPPGTFGATEGLKDVVECTPCHPGKYCENYGLTDVQGKLNCNFYVIIYPLK